MFNGQVETELLDAVSWLFGQQPQLPPHLQSSVNEQQGRQDIWELPTKDSPSLPKEKSPQGRLHIAPSLSD
ncbi:hypothetical protein I8752_36315 [Nostocaceae cyanobacterium CENA369]|uniref:Uncharacterized protein n=1 Tax=Dendronalium phyllosphericum CENA369 TaxID=1725256 RepID=A0A8J7IWA5_9NOST|nr:hypothetical protein [Dendronalium phyllosphericum]MBH8578312.1 hypothetical protein [Dendronalium phyllosphericum CENA369]